MSDEKDQFWKALASSPFLMVRLDSAHQHAIPMTAQLDEELGPRHGGAVWFFADADNRLAPGGRAMAQFVAKGHDLFACLSGNIQPEPDRALIDRFWSNPVAAWYEGGKDDPRLLLLRMDIDDIEIWTSDMGFKGRFKLLTGQTMRPGEAGSHVREAV